MSPASVYPNPDNPRSVTPAIVSRFGDAYELLAGHQRVALAQLAGVRFPAVVMDTGETVWIEPDGSVTTHEQPHDAGRPGEPEGQPGGRAPAAR